MYDFTYQSQRLISLLSTIREVLIVTHQKPDGDAIGSATALSAFLAKWGIHTVIFCVHAPPEQFHYLPHLERFSGDPSVFSRGSHDALMVLDSSDLAYAGIETYVTSGGITVPLINIDHHASNKAFGDLVLLDPYAPSTTAILYRFMTQHHRHLIDHHIATSLLTGLLTDTSHFSNPATSDAALRIGAELLKHGARYRTITNATWHRRELPTLRTWGKALSQLSFVPSYRVAISVLANDEDPITQSDKDATEGIANFLSNIKDADVVMLLKDQHNGTIRGSLRTVRDDIDVSRFAKALGGGGHRKAAGFSVKGSLVATDQGWRVVI